GQLATGTTDDASTPRPVRQLGAVVAAAAGSQFTVAVRADGDAWAWGRNDAGQLGDGTTTDRRVPVRVAGVDDVAAVAAGFDHVVALDAHGDVWAWGADWGGQLGDGAGGDAAQPPALVPGLPDAVAVAAG